MTLLYSSSRQIRLSTTYNQVRYISVAYAQTIAIIYIRDKVTYIAHFGKQGELIFEQIIHPMAGSFGMMNEECFIFLSPNTNSITIVSLKDYSFRHIFHHLTDNLEDQTYLEYFYQSQLICVVQLRNPDKDRLKLTYYPFSGDKDIKPIESYQSGKEWKFNNLVKKGNNLSLIIWLQSKASKHLQFYTFQLKDNKSGVLMNYKIKRDIETRSPQITISDIWQAADKSILALYAFQKHKLSTSYLIADLLNGTLKEDHATLDDGILSDSAYFGSFSIFSTHQRAYQQFQFIPKLIYFDNDSKSVIKSTNENYYNYASYHQQQMGLYRSNYLYFQQFKAKIIRVMRPKEIALHFLLHIHEDFDDDLLQDALELLDVL